MVGDGAKVGLRPRGNQPDRAALVSPLGKDPAGGGEEAFRVESLFIRAYDLIHTVVSVKIRFGTRRISPETRVGPLLAHAIALERLAGPDSGCLREGRAP